jgi:hypothetical protein
VNHRVVNSESSLCALIGSSLSECARAERAPEERSDAHTQRVNGDRAQGDHERGVSSLYHRHGQQAFAAPRAGMGWLSRAGTVLGTVGVALLPKCPACWSVYAGLSGWLGLSIALDPALLLPLTLLCLGLTLLVLARGARRSGRYQPLAWAALAAVGVYLGKFALESPLCAHVSLGALVLAALAGRRAERRSKLAQHA